MWLRDQADVVEANDADSLERELPSAEALVVRTYTKVTSDLLDRAPKLRVVGRAGVGLDNIDLDACASRGVEVVNTPDANTTAVAEYVLSAALTALRPLDPLARAVDRPEWERLRREAITPKQLEDLTVGILGLGKTGKGVAARFRCLARRVIYYDVEEIPEPDRHGAEPVEFDEMLVSSDILTVHVDARPDNHDLIDAPQLATMKPDAVLINAARGVIVNENALADHLARHPHARAVIDVFEPEPFTEECPLLNRPNALLTPHIAAATTPAKLAMSWVVRDVVRALESSSD
jgi:phosphoglycerate dehydrogenase-like enzyme